MNREIFPKSGCSNPNLDRNYFFQMNLAPKGIPLCAKSIGKRANKIQTLFNLTIFKRDSSLCVYIYIVHAYTLYMHICIQTYIYNMHTNKYVWYTYMYTYIHTNMYTCIHTHKHLCITCNHQTNWLGLEMPTTTKKHSIVHTLFLYTCQVLFALQSIISTVQSLYTKASKL